MLALAAAMGIGRFVYTPILPSMMTQLGLTAGEAGLIASANYLGYLLGALASAGGWAAGRERAIMLSGLGASAVLAATMGLTTSAAAFVAIRFLAGLASAFVMVFAAAIVFGRLAAAGRSDLQSVHFAGVGVGIAISAVMIALLHVASAGWAAAWFWSGAISAAALAGVAVLAERGPPAAAGAPAREPGLPRNRALTSIILAYGLFGFGYIVTATFLVAIVRQNGEGPLFESLVWLVTGVVIVPSIYLWQQVAGRIGLAKAFAAGCAVEAAGVVASVALGGKSGPIIGGALLGGTFVAITALGLQLGRLAAPDAPRRVFALMTASFGFGQIVGPVVAGIAAEATGSYLWPSLAAALALVIGALLVVRAD
ncbi:YbfB/YjiJ family MFS transporter [Arvimicrobium flavum]|uniref:YbfB/YjiJ family MFS transporter n=1 Tax=Arvimicrobium flavum TaxID=3393320 RepID=UPI00237A540C|nr:YbfB/YjiJ family MFS transporter [Mesorhizobium shangrilense]